MNNIKRSDKDQFSVFLAFLGLYEITKKLVVLDQGRVVRLYILIQNLAHALYEHGPAKLTNLLITTKECTFAFTHVVKMASIKTLYWATLAGVTTLVFLQSIIHRTGTSKIGTRI